MLRPFLSRHKLEVVGGYKLEVVGAKNYDVLKSRATARDLSENSLFIQSVTKCDSLLIHSKRDSLGDSLFIHQSIITVIPVIIT